MIRSFLNHHAERLRRGGRLNALMHCHVRGLASVMLHDEPGNRVRLFYATADHELWRNETPLGHDMSLAIHPHHCDVTLTLVFGRVCNTRYVALPDSRGDFYECRYDSAINGGAGGLIPTGLMFNMQKVMQGWVYPSGDRMLANELHSIYVPKGEMAAWLVFEGNEDPNYQPVCYTRNPAFEPSGMYRPMESIAVERILRDSAFFREPE